MIKSEKIWNVIANNYDESEKRYEPIHIRTLLNTRKYLNPGDVILDFGCGTGTQTLEIAGDVKEVHGIDISSKMIEIAKKKAYECKTTNVGFSKGTIFDERLRKDPMMLFWLSISCII